MTKKYGSTAFLDQVKDKVLAMIKQGRKPEHIAVKFGVSERSLWYWLKKNNISISQLREETKKQKEELLRKGIEEIDKALQVPIDFNEFLNLSSVKTFIEELKASNLNKRYINYVLKKIYDCSKTLEVHPEVLDKDLVNKYLAGLEAGTSTIQNVKNALRQWLKFLGKPISKSLGLKEYDGKYKQAYFNVKERLEFLRTAKKLYPEQYEKIRDIILFLFYTGSRAEALTNVQFREEENHAKAITLEKGKGGKIQWEKTISKELCNNVKKYLPFNNGDLMKFREIVKTIIANMECNEISKKYGLEHPLHIWRHTACVSCLYAFNWNIYVVGKLLGWKNPKMIINVYGDIPSEILMKLALGEKVETPPFQFLYNDYLKQAINEGLL
jgi:integrase